MMQYHCRHEYNSEAVGIQQPLLFKKNTTSEKDHIRRNDTDYIKFWVVNPYKLHLLDLSNKSLFFSVVFLEKPRIGYI